MVRFHFKNNEKLDTKFINLCNSFNCNAMSAFINKVLFRNFTEFLIFINYYCSKDRDFKVVQGCRINRKVSIPDEIYHSLKLCHKEKNTFSIAFIWRSFLIDVVECFLAGGLVEWENFKREVIESGQIQEKQSRDNNKFLLNSIYNVHIPGISSLNISKIVFFTIGNRFLGHLRC